MSTVGIRALKAQLSEYLGRVAAGEHVTVTDRGRPVATISPAGEAPAPAWLRTILAEGRARWSGGKPIGLDTRVPSRGHRASQDVLDDRR